MQSKNKKRLNLFMTIFGFITGSAFNIFLFFLTIFLIYTTTIKAFEYGEKTANEIVEVKPSEEVKVHIPEDATIMDMAKILKDEGLIGNEYLFVLETRLNGTYDLLKPGDYVLNMNMNTAKIVEALQTVQGKVATDDVKVTVPEGLTLKQIAELLESKELFTAEEFLEACETGEFNYDFIKEIPERENRLEGYLFPDTYFLTKNPTPNEIIRKMLDRFDDIYSPELRQRTEEMGLTIDEVITMASIIESEIARADERELASAIIYNRLEADMPLQMCSSIMYVLDKRKDRLLFADLEIDSPYNTYTTTGLPVGPISNPGADSINAALYPADTDFLYFVLKDEETGEHLFTDDYNEFVNAKDLYNQQF